MNNRNHAYLLSVTQGKISKQCDGEGAEGGREEDERNKVMRSRTLL